MQGVPRLRARSLQPPHGLYRTFRWGKNLELFFLDERSFRSAKVDRSLQRRPRADRAAGRAARVRAALARRSRTRSRRRASTRSTTRQRTMLGAAQFAAFTKAIRASTATLKVIVNEEPIHAVLRAAVRPLGGLRGRAGAALDVLQASVKNVVFLTTDTHANLVSEVRH